MTGFTLGEASGGTLGNTTGGTLGTQPTVYLVDGEPITQVTNEQATDESLALTLRVTSQSLIQTVRQLKPDEGKVNLLRKDDGGFTAVDRAGGANTFTLTFPQRRTPLREDGVYHVRRYEESLVSQTVGEWTVDVEFALDSEREGSPSITRSFQVPSDTDVTGGTLGDTSGFTLGGADGSTLGSGNRAELPAEWWEFDTRFGPISTDRVDADFLGTGRDGVRRFELTARLTTRQSNVFEKALNRLGGVRVRNVPDAPNIAVDETSGEDLTLDVISPAEGEVSSGEYVVLAWSTERLNDAFQTYTFEVAESG